MLRFLRCYYLHFTHHSELLRSSFGKLGATAKILAMENQQKSLLLSWLQQLGVDVKSTWAQRKIADLLKEWQHSSYLDRQTPQLSTRRYDQIIARLFEQVQAANSCEQMLDWSLDELDDLGAYSGSSCFFVIEAECRDGAILLLRGGSQRRLHPKHWDNFCQGILPKLKKSQLLRQLFIGYVDVNLWFLPYIYDYAGEFDNLHSKKNSNRRGDQASRGSYWLSALPLPSRNKFHPARALCALYPDHGSHALPAPPSGAAQEWRVLHFVQLAYGQLEHQLTNITSLIQARREQLIHELAPGIIHHEMQQRLNIIGVDLNKFISQLYDLAEDFYEPRLNQAAQEAITLQGSVQEARAISDSFSRFEKRNSVEEFSTAQLFGDLRRLLNHKLGEVGAQLHLPPAESCNYTLHTDQVMLLHLLLNLIVNACEAFADAEQSGNTDREQQAKFIAVDAQLDADNNVLRLSVSNNGPAIPPHLSEKIFARGFSTRVAGHGQGLYICRLIAQYLGGALELVSNDELPPERSVAFRLYFTIDKS